MAKRTENEETGITPSATDAVPDPEQRAADSEFEKRRQLKEERERAEEAAVAGKAANGGRPVDAQEDAEDDGQGMFVWEQGRKVTLGTLIARGIPVEHAFVFGGKRMKGSGGLVGFDDDVLMVVRGKMSNTNIVATRDDDERVSKVTVETHIATKVIAPADSEHGLDMLAGVFAKRGIRAA